MNGQGRWYLGATLAYAVIIAVVALGLLGLYRASRQRLDDALGDRLLGIGTSLAVMADADLIFNASVGDSSAVYYLELLDADFLNLSRQENLAEITLCDPEGRVLASSSGNLKSGQVNSFWDLDRVAVEQALAGAPAATELYQLQTTYQKSAHVPVIVDDSFSGAFVVGVLTVSGSPDFFQDLGRLRTAALVTALLVLVLLVILAYLLHRINLAMQRYRQSLQEQETLAAMGRMTAGIAHEIRNPLGIIRGAGQHLQKVLAGAGIEDEIATFIPEEVDRLDGILGGYLALGKDAPGPVEVFDLSQTTRRSLDLAAAEMKAAGIKIESRLPPEILVRGNPRQMQQVLLNLLLNARDAMPGGGLAEVALVWKENQVSLTVTDQGTGLAGLTPDQAFAPFFTTKEKGSGLGLATSRRIIEDMGGTLVLENRKDGPGAEARILLPAQADQER